MKLAEHIPTAGPLIYSPTSKQEHPGLGGAEAVAALLMARSSRKHPSYRLEPTDIPAEDEGFEPVEHNQHLVSKADQFGEIHRTPEEPG